MKRRTFIESGVTLAGIVGSAGCLGLFRGQITGNWAVGEWHDATNPYVADGLRADSGGRFYAALVTDGPTKAVFVDSKPAQNFAETMQPIGSSGRSADFPYNRKSLLLIEARMPADDAFDILQTGAEWTGRESALVSFEIRPIQLRPKFGKNDTNIRTDEAVLTSAQPVNNALQTIRIEVTHRKYGEQTVFETEEIK